DDLARHREQRPQDLDAVALVSVGHRAEPRATGGSLSTERSQRVVSQPTAAGRGAIRAGIARVEAAHWAVLTRRGPRKSELGAIWDPARSVLIGVSDDSIRHVGSVGPAARAGAAAAPPIPRSDGGPVRAAGGRGLRRRTCPRDRGRPRGPRSGHA